ncbi:hypothetical protein F4561_004176 [Lipingzhangella halophila]|uniref:Uncharacterized protein n=1 Tax=Lipingzhangella halophila TaxID=1783352 RepID=A0A7W7RKT8_9ACTN|nr:hypothetical protein [Lipingzhangella halophila]MBB4933356.1 hypothetical protein [Lipingzhangella halophila]
MGHLGGGIPRHGEGAVGIAEDQAAREDVGRRIRAPTSVPPPGAWATIIWIGRSG